MRNFPNSLACSISSANSTFLNYPLEHDIVSPMPKSEQEHIDTTVNPKEEPTPEYVELPTDAGAFLEQISPQLYQVHFGTKVNFPVDGAPFVQGQTIVVGTARRLGDGPSFQATAALLTARNAAAEAMVNGEIDTVVEVHEEGGEAILNSSFSKSRRS